MLNFSVKNLAQGGVRLSFYRWRLQDSGIQS
jgi:hypothetical protein